MTPDQERELFERVARLEGFAARLVDLLGAAGKVLDAGRLVVQASGLRGAHTWTGQQPEKERHRER